MWTVGFRPTTQSLRCSLELTKTDISSARELLSFPPHPRVGHEVAEGLLPALSICDRKFTRPSARRMFRWLARGPCSLSQPQRHQPKGGGGTAYSQAAVVKTCNDSIESRVLLNCGQERLSRGESRCRKVRRLEPDIASHSIKFYVEAEVARWGRSIWTFINPVQHPV